MPIAKIRLPNGKIGRFEVPEGTSEAEVMAFAESQFSAGAPELPGVQDEFMSTSPEELAEFSRVNKGVDVRPEITGQHPGNQFMRTLENVGQVAPAVDAGLNLITGGIAAPIAGLTGLAATARGLVSGEGLDASLRAGKQTIEGVSGALTHQPKLQRGAELAESAAFIPRKFKEGGEFVGNKLQEAGFPNLGATAATIGEAAPLLAGAKLAVPKNPVTQLAQATRKTKQLVVDSINQALKPPKAVKKTAEAVKSFDNKALGAVESIVKNEELAFLDEAGTVVKRLPRSLEDFQGAISQTKAKIFKAYDRLTKETDAVTSPTPSRSPREVSGRVAVKELGKVVQTAGGPKVVLTDLLNNSAIRSTSPATLAYAKKRVAAISKERYTASNAQNAIQILNKTLEAYYKDPTPALYGKSLVDSLIVNNLRKELTTIIEKTTGKEYAALKKEYGNIIAMEDSVAKAANSSRNQKKGVLLPNFTEVIAGHQIISGLAAGSPATVLGGGFLQAIASLRKRVRDPNVRVKKMFETVDKSLKEQSSLKGKIAQRQGVR